MKMREKKIVKSLVVLLFALAIVCGSYETIIAEEVISGDFTFEITDGNAVLMKYTGSDSAVVVFSYCYSSSF